MKNVHTFDVSNTKITVLSVPFVFEMMILKRENTIFLKQGSGCNRVPNENSVIVMILYQHHVLGTL